MQKNEYNKAITKRKEKHRMLTEKELFALENKLFAELESAKGLKKLAIIMKLDGLMSLKNEQ